MLPSTGAAAIAPVSRDAAAAILIVGFLVFLGVLAHPEARGLHDMAAGTTVVRWGS